MSSDSKDQAIAALKLLKIDDLYDYAYYMAEAHHGLSDNIDKWVEAWKKQREEILQLKSVIKDLAQALGRYSPGADSIADKILKKHERIIREIEDGQT